MDIPWLLILYISLGGGALIWLLITWLNRRDNKRFGKIADKWNLGRFKQGRATFRTRPSNRRARLNAAVLRQPHRHGTRLTGRCRQPRY